VSEFVEIMLIAMGLQLAVLPGEKVQFIIAGLSTRYHPLLVVSAAGLAFAGWTALEILFGRAVQGMLPGPVLDAISGGLFLLFGVLLLKSMPESGDVSRHVETDGGLPRSSSDLDVSVLGYDVPDRLGGFLPIFSLMAVGEFGDKTQIVTIGLALEYGAHPAIWAGEMLAIIPVSLANAYFFHTFSHRFDARKAHWIAAGLFFFFGFDTFLALLFDVSVWETIVGALASLLPSVSWLPSV
jgi:putative Ca2+/H+ antiporter (TMEM165/GDT1 family)